MKGIPVLAAALLSLAVSTPVFAETPEEAVAYAFVGLSDGGAIARGKTTMSWKQTASSPAHYEAEAASPGQNYTIGFTVTAVDNCHYEIVINGPPKLVRSGKALYAKIDLSKVTGVTVAEHAVKALVSGHGFCETGSTNPDCMPIDTSDLFASVDIEKHKATMAFLRDEVCPAQ